jgi:outer membrane receptor for ferrienterochelin and colicin
MPQILPPRTLPRLPAIALLLPWLISSTPVMAQMGTDDADAAQTPQLREVVVSSRRSLEDRFFSTGSLVVVDRQDIEQMGVETVTDVLRQLPGVQVTPNANGSVDIRMRGMDSSATRVLIDGQRSGGRAQLPFDQLPAELIERIEVIRAPSAEYSGASGGTINFVLRQATSQRSGSLRLSNSHVWGRNAGQLFVSRTGPLGGAAAGDAAAPGTVPPAPSPWSYFLALAGSGQLSGSDVEREHSTDGTPSASGSARTRNRREEWTLLPRLNGRLGPKDQLALRATLTSSAQAGRYDSSGTGTGSSGAYASSASESSGQDKRYVQAAADWTRRFDAGKLETSLSGSQLSEAVQRTGVSSLSNSAGSSSSNSDFSDDRRESVWSLKTKLTGTKTSLLWMMGVELESRQAQVQTQSSSSPQQNLSADVQRQVLWGQNEWALPLQTTLTAGLRGESISLRSTSSGLAASQQLNFLQPSLHTRTPIGEDTQWRTNISRITRNPGVWDLVDRTVPSQGNNSISNPDQVGNTGLRPEVAQTLDMGVEQRLPRQGQMGLSLFVRQIQDVIAVRSSLLADRWTEQRDNIGSARAWGLEADIKKPLTEAAWGRDWNLTAHGSLLQSRMTSGADAGLRIPGQARYVVNVGVNKPFRRNGGSFGGVSVAVTGPASLSTAGVSGINRARATLDVYVGSVVPRVGFWRVGIYNVGDARYVRERSYQDSLGRAQTDISQMSLTPRLVLSVGTQF